MFSAIIVLVLLGILGVVYYPRFRKWHARRKFMRVYMKQRR